jgi:DNA-binding NarL/FixJ family response regulator
MLEGYGYEVVAEAADGLEAINCVEKHKPDILIVDMIMGTMDGLDVTRHVVKTSPGTIVIIVSMYDDENYVLESIRAGAKAYVLKDSSSEDLLRAIHAAMAGSRFLSQSLLEKAIDIYSREMPSAEQDPYHTLSPRERETFHMVAAGDSSAKIAERLFISRRTVEVHRANLMRKLGISSRSELIRLAQEHGHPENPIESNINLPSPRLSTPA